MKLMSNLNFNLMKQKLLFLSLCALILSVGLYAQTDPGTANITHQWTFDGDASDAYGGVVGTLEGTATIADGHLVIDAADSWLTLNGLLIGLSAYTEASIATWFTTLPGPDINTGFHMIWYFGGSEIPEGGDIEFGSNGIFLSPARGDDVCRTAISCGDVATPWLSETGVNRTPEIAFGDSTYHIVTTINDTYIALYVNGVLVDTANLSANNSLGALSDDFAWIGRGGYAGDPNYWCMVDEVTIYNKMLTPDEVLFLSVPPSSLPDAYRQNGYSLNVYATGGTIHVENVDNVDITSIQIYDISGRIMYETDGYEEIINTNLPASLYIVRAHSNLGDFTTKLVVQ